MRLIDQKAQIEKIQARATTRGLKSLIIRSKIKHWKVYYVENMEILAWSFAVGAWLGTGSKPEKEEGAAEDSTSALIKVFNTTFLVWRFVTSYKKHKREEDTFEHQVRMQKQYQDAITDEYGNVVVAPGLGHAPSGVSVPGPVQRTTTD